MGRLVKLGLIGCGQVTEERHLPALKTLPGVEVVAVADVDPARLTKVADQFHIARRSTDFRAILEDPSIDAIAVCVPARFHVEVAMEALDKGKHLFIEKPLALDLDESDRLIEKAAQSSCKVMVGFNLRWHRLVRQAREIIQKGTLGPLQLIRTVLTSYHKDVSEWRKRREHGGGVLVEMAVHHFDLWRFLLGSEVEEVFTASRSEQWDDMTATVTARMANGVLASTVLSQRTSSNQEVEIYGQAGQLRVACYDFDGLGFFPVTSTSGHMRIRMSRIAHAFAELPQAALRLRQGGDYVASYRSEWRHFIDSIQGNTSVECSLEDGRRAVEVMLAVLESASLNKPVKVAQAQRRITPVSSHIPARNQKQ